MSHLEPELLSAYLDAEVTSAERAAVDGHTASCDACAAILEELRFAAASVRDLDAPAMPELHRKQLWREINRTRRAPTTKWRALVAVAGTAAAIAAFAGLTVLGTSGGPNVFAGDASLEQAETAWSKDDLAPLMTGIAVEGHGITTLETPLDAPSVAEVRSEDGVPARVFELPDENHGARIAQCEESIRPGGDGGAIAVRYIVAIYDEVPAYILVYDVPRAGPTHREVYVVVRDTCGILEHRTEV